MVNFYCNSLSYKVSLLGGSFLWIFNQPKEADVLLNLPTQARVLSLQRSVYTVRQIRNREILIPWEIKLSLIRRVHGLNWLVNMWVEGTELFTFCFIITNFRKCHQAASRSIEINDLCLLNICLDGVFVTTN